LAASKPSAEHELRLYAIADFDLQWCQRYLVAYVELMTPPDDADADPWQALQSREFPGEFNFVDILARALGQAIVVSYSRPWSRNRSQGPGRLPKSILSDMAKLFRRDAPTEPLLPFDHALHERVLCVRDKIVAHSDHHGWDFDVEIKPHATETRLSDPFSHLSAEEARTLLTNTESLRSELAARRRSALASMGESS